MKLCIRTALEYFKLLAPPVIFMLKFHRVFGTTVTRFTIRLFIVLKLHINKLRMYFFFLSAIGVNFVHIRNWNVSVYLTITQQIPLLLVIIGHGTTTF